MKKLVTLFFFLFLVVFCASVYADSFSFPGIVLIKLKNGDEIKAVSCTQQDDITVYSLPGNKKVYQVGNDEIYSISNCSDSYPDVASQTASDTTRHTVEKPKSPVLNTAVQPTSEETTRPAIKMLATPVPKSSILGKAVTIKTLTQQIRNLFYHEQFEELEKIAKEFRDNKSRFSDGLFKLHYFYNSLRSPEKETEQNYQTLFSILNKWAKKYPNSITQRVAEAGAWVQYGWFARGNGYADTVTDEGWQLFSVRLQKAYEILTQTNISQTGDCPERYAVLLTIGRGQGWEREKYNMIFKSAISFDPTYYSFYFEKVQYLLPRWGGTPGEWQQFAEDATKMTPQAEGKGIYARILWYAWGLGEWKNFTYPGISWGKMKQGFLDIEKEYPDSGWNLNYFALFAVRANDTETAYGLFKKIGDNPLIEVWGTKASYDSYRDMITTVYMNSYPRRGAK